MRKKLIFMFFMFFILFNLANISASQDFSEKIEIDYFWMSGCPACNQMKVFLEGLEQKYDFNLNSYSTSSYSGLFSQRIKEFNVSLDRAGYVPTIFIKDSYFVGYSEQIKESIELILKGENIDDEIPVGEIVKTKILGFWDVEVSLNEKTIFGIGLILAFLDSINVCSITVLIFLVIFTLSIGSAKKSFKIGLTFTIVIFIFYFLFMLLLTSILGIFVNNYGGYIRMIVFLISFLAGFILIKDFFWYGKGISLKVPDSAKPFLEKYMKQATIGSTIILGILASLVELPCTAIFPLIYTTILAESNILGFQRIIYILFYNLIYIWPLLFIVFGTYFSWTKIEKVDEKIQKSKKLMKLIAGIALVLISFYFIWPLIIR